MVETGASSDERQVDFFVSRAGADADFAAVIARILEDAGHRVILQQWDFANGNFIERMDTALRSTNRVVALLSNDYLASDHCKAEWQSAIADDPLNRRGRLILFRVAECDPPGLLTALAYWDLVPIRDDANLVRDIVRAAVQPGRHKPEASPLGIYWRAPRAIVHPEIRPTPSFTGRASELAAIAAALATGATAALTQPAAVHGLGGIGKSVLAREYALRNQDRYAGVWWLNAAQDNFAAGFDGIESGLVKLGATFIRGLDEIQGREAAARTTLRFLAEGGFEKPWLLIYDNVDSAKVLPAWQPPANIELLLTSRLSGWSDNVRLIEINEWSLPDAIAYLRRESGRSDLSDADATAIAKALGCLPLALSHATAYLRMRQNVSSQRYLAGLTERMRTAPRDAEYGRAVFATFQQALDEAAGEAPMARNVLSLAAFFAPDAIPEELFFPPETPESKRAAIEDGIGALAHLSLIDFDPEGRTFSLHRLVQAAARDALDDTVTWADFAVANLHANFPADVEDSRNWPICERFVPHVRVTAGHGATETGDFALLLSAAATYLETRAALADVLALHRRSEQIFRGLAAAGSNKAHWERKVAMAQLQVGDALLAQGETSAARQSYSEAFAIVERLAKNDPGSTILQRDLAISHSKIGDFLRDQQNRAAALANYRASQDIFDHLTKIDPRNVIWQRDLALAQQKIGEVLVQLGCFADALDSHQASLAIRERLIKIDPDNTVWQRDLAISHDGIGIVLVNQQNFTQALDNYRAAQNIFERLVKIDPGNVVWQRDLYVLLSCVGATAITMGDREEARAAWQQGLAMTGRLTALVPDHAGFAADRAWFEARIAELGD